LDATVLPYDHAAMGSKAGLRILADMPTLVQSFPDKVIIMRRSFVQKERDMVKKFYRIERIDLRDLGQSGKGYVGAE
jgi:ABC-type nitrate/sulfonate/bicarbonate transport system substrate-binding protein